MAKALETAQQLFWRAITWPTGVADFLAQADDQTRKEFEATFATTASFGRVERVDVYAESYYWRLHGVLLEDYGLLAWIIGDDRFLNLCTDYVLARRSVNPDIGEFGARLPDFVADHEVSRTWPFLADIARAERAMIEVLHEQDQLAVTLASLASLPASTWPQLRFEVTRALRLVQSRWNFAALWRTMKAGEPAPQLSTEPGDHPLLVFRRAFNVSHRNVAPGQLRALQALQRGDTFAHACEAASESDPEEAAAQVAGWLAEWVERGLLVAVR